MLCMLQLTGIPDAPPTMPLWLFDGESLLQMHQLKRFENLRLHCLGMDQLCLGCELCKLVQL